MTTAEETVMTAEVLRPGPIMGSGDRVRMLQRSILATRLSNAASVAASLLHYISTHQVDPNRLQAQRARAREFVSVIRELENSDESQMFELSELVPRKMWDEVREDLAIPTTLADSLSTLLDSIDSGTYTPEELTDQSEILLRLASRLQAEGRDNLSAARKSSRELTRTAARQTD